MSQLAGFQYHFSGRFWPSFYNYCIQIAPEFSDLPEDQVYKAVSDAFVYWKNNLKKYDAYSLPTTDWSDTKAIVGTQEFILQQECNSKTDLKFQLGVLSEDQKKEINYKQLIGLAQRTHYDSVNLKGRGFIYIAPERGALRPDSSKLMNKPWSVMNGQVLKYTIYHELGHIFGLQDDYYANWGLMSAHFVEEITDKASVLARAIYSFREPTPLGCNQNLEGFAQMAGKFDDEDEMTSLRKFLGLGDNFSVYLLSDANGLKIRDVKTNKEFGEIVYSRSNPMDGKNERAISLYLTKKQKVFKNIQNNVLNSQLGLYPMVVSTGLKDEELLLSNGNKLKVFVQFDRNCIPKIGGMFNDQLFFDLIFGE